MEINKKKLFNFIKYLKKGIIILISFILILNFLIYIFSADKNIKKMFFFILDALGFGAFYLINMLPSTSFLCYKIDRLINKINYLNSTEKIKENFFLFLIKIILVIPIFLLIFSDKMIFNFKMSLFLKEVLKIKGGNIINAKIIITNYIFPFIYVFLLFYLAEKFLIFYYKRKNLQKS